jgi:branched-chain amino acid transport system ATP-binding protein
MSETVVETHDLSVRFGGVLAVNNVSFALRDRELRCLIGPNGAGKSTFFKSITGQIRGAQSSGRVVIRGEDVTGWSTHRIVRLGIGVKTQVPSVMSGLTVEENLWLAARRTLERDAVAAAVEEVVATFGLADFARRQMSELSHGQRQLAEIGMVLAGRPWLVLLDEPAAGMTGPELDELETMIRLLRSAGITVLLVEHHAELVMRLCDRVTVIDVGRVLITDEPAIVSRDPAVVAAYLGDELTEAEVS